MQMPFCAIMRSWTLLAAFGGSYAPGITYTCVHVCDRFSWNDEMQTSLREHTHYVHFSMRNEKEERTKQARSNNQTRQSNTAYPRQSLFLRKMYVTAKLYILYLTLFTYHYLSNTLKVHKFSGIQPKVNTDTLLTVFRQTFFITLCVPDVSTQHRCQ